MADASTEKISLTKEKETLLITLYAKAADSRSAKPILDDPVAPELIKRIDYDFSKFSRDDSVGAAVRAKLLDTDTREFIAEHPDALVLHLACGLDSRVVRVAPPPTVLWYDVDYPDVIDIRRRLFDKRPGCHMLGVSVTDPGWLEELPADRPVIVVAEGLMMYLAEDDVRRLLQRITDHFAAGELAFDVVSPLCGKLMSKHPSVKMTGAEIRWGMDDPDEPQRWNPRLHLLGIQHTIEYTVTSGVVSNLQWYNRIACRLMNVIPPLRHLTALVRYRFQPGEPDLPVTQ